MPSLALPYPLDLNSTLLGGQSFCWNPNPDGSFNGWIGGLPVQLRVIETTLIWDHHDLSADLIGKYFCLDLNLPQLLGDAAQDPWLSAAATTYPGLRPVREEPWECLVNFLCSSLKQIVQIQQINARLRTKFGSANRSFPSSEVLAQAGEKELRECGLGYRAKHVWNTALFVSRQPNFLLLPCQLPTTLAAQHLEQLPGVGPKISRCVLLYAYSRWDAFPVDVWVDRLIRELYFPRRRQTLRPETLENWSLEKFGSGRGLAQLQLFHWFRTRAGAKRRGAKAR